MTKKSELLIELGWNDALIRHFMVEDYEFGDSDKSQLPVQCYDTHSMTLDFNANNSGSNFIVRTRGN